MAPTPRPEGTLSEAALALEQELSRYEKICAELRRTVVRSEKTLSRTKHLLTESAECEQALGQLLQGLLQAMNGARSRQETCMQTTLDAAQALRERALHFQALMGRVEQLGQLTREVSQPAAAVIASAGLGENATALEPLHEVAERMNGVLLEADAIAGAADEGDWPEIAREVKNLRQQIQAAHSKVVQAKLDLEKRVLS